MGRMWEWASEVYRRPGVEPLLLRLQDGHGLDVNLVLWCLWCSTRYEEPQLPLIRKAVDLTGEWTASVVVPLRSIRRYLKAAPAQATLLERIKVVELAAEKIELEALEAFAASALQPATAGDPIGRGRRTLASYARLTNAAKTPGFSVSLLEELIELIFPSPESGGVSK